MTRDAGERFLLIAPQGLGDSLEATPILRALRRARPNARLEVAVTRNGPRALFASLPEHVDAVIDLPYWEKGGAAFLAALVREGRGRRYDASFLAFPSARPAYQVLSARFAADRRFAHRHDSRTLFDLPFFRATLVDVRPVHNVERNRDLLRAAGIDPGSESGYLVPPGWVALADEPRGGIAMHVGSIAHAELAAKRWPLGSFIELAKRLVRDYGEVSLIVGADEREESLALARDVPGIALFEGSLPEVARHLSRCAAVVSNDNGIAHLAAGVGAPTIALFGPTPVEHGPFSPDAVLLRPSDCPPCFDVRRPIVRCVRGIDFRCLKRDLTVDLVERTVRDVVEARCAILR